MEAGITSGETQNVTVDLTVPEDAAAKETLKVEAISVISTSVLVNKYSYAVPFQIPLCTAA